MLLPVAPKHKLVGLKYSLTYRKRLCQPFCVWVLTSTWRKYDAPVR